MPSNHFLPQPLLPLYPVFHAVLPDLNELPTIVQLQLELVMRM